jgi:hypothetical protein
LENKRITAVVMVGLGLSILLYSGLILAWERMALPPWTFETEGKYVAYSLLVWTHGLGNMPIGAILVLLGIFFYPFSSRKKEILAVPVIFGFASSAALVYIGWNIVNHWIETLRFPTPFQILGGFIFMYLPLTAVFGLSIFVACRKLRSK